jgi:hypothetical protein
MAETGNSSEELRGGGRGEPLGYFSTMVERREVNAMEQGKADAALRV